MYIKNIKLSGFKSFVDRTTVSLERGITAIVGPNGCGKSNICDSLRWVFGEQSSRLLRGGKMEELIFNGSESRKAVGMAEVAVTLCGLNGAIKRAELSDFDEITVTRRLFRSGESAYLINKTSCRLKDIVEIFLDTGISTRSFSIMEQTQVNRLIVSKPFERRYIIEEAAGVIKYKHKRHEALNRIDASRQNLLRIQDIVRELETQMNSLKRQSGKARRYKAYREELHEVGVSLLSFEYENLRSLYIKTEAEYQTLKKSGEESEAYLLEKQEVLTALRNDIEESNRILAEKRHLEFEACTATKQAGERAILLEEQEVSLKAEIRCKKDDIDALKEELLSLSEKSALCVSESLEINNELTDKDLTYAKEKAALDDLVKGMTDAAGEIIEREKNILDTIERISKERNRLTEAETRLGGVSARENRLDSEINETFLSAEELTGKLAAASSSLLELNESLEIKVEEGRVVKSALSETREKIKELDPVTAALKESFSRKKGLLESREELRKNFEGLGGGVKAVMGHHRAGRLTGISGLLVDIIRTSPDYETAFEAAFADKLTGVIVENPESGLAAAEMLEKNMEGKCVFLPRNGPVLPVSPPECTSAEGLVGRALDLIQKSDHDYRRVFEAALGNVLIFDTVENALLFYNSNVGRGWKVITMDGISIDPDGVVTGGKKAENSSNLLSKNREIQELRKEVERAGREIEDLELRRKALAVTEKEYEDADRSAAFEIQELKIQTGNTGMEIERLSSDEGRLKRKLETLTFEKEQVSEEREALLGDSADAKAFLNTEERELKELTDALSVKKDEISRGREELDTLKEKMNASKVEVASLRAKLEFLASEKSRISRDKEGLKSRLTRLDDEIRESEIRIRQIVSDTARRQEDISRFSKTRENLKNEIAATAGETEEMLGSLAICEEELTALEKELAAARETLAGVNLKKSETAMRIDHLQKRGREEYASGPDDLLSVYDGFCEASARDRVEFLKKELARYGDVNLSAIPEYEKVYDRFTFLKTQEDDLVQSIRSLDETIKKIDHTTGKLFSETFETINENFKKMFRRLFGGGKAELVLVEGEEGRDPGIDILAQPPGKKLRNIQLMSAGEKAMTAISILFSVFMVRPSPFCLLDEIDAPLDDSNIGRFREMVKELVSETQFVMITHNQKTMTFADRLYGVTMEEHGVSKVLSVDVKEDIKETDEGGDGVDFEAARLMEDAVPV